MGNLKNSDLIEIIFWLLIAVVFFSVSFNFNQPIEIYNTTGAVGAARAYAVGALTVFVSTTLVWRCKSSEGMLWYILA